MVGERIQTGRETQAEVSLRGGEEVIQLRSGSLFTVNDLSRRDEAFNADWEGQVQGGPWPKAQAKVSGPDDHGHR